MGFADSTELQSVHETSPMKLLTVLVLERERDGQFSVSMSLFGS